MKSHTTPSPERTQPQAKVDPREAAGGERGDARRGLRRARGEARHAEVEAQRKLLNFQRDLATAQGNELRATVDYNKSLSNLARNKATTLERYSLRLE